MRGSRNGDPSVKAVLGARWAVWPGVHVTLSTLYQVPLGPSEQVGPPWGSKAQRDPPSEWLCECWS